MCAEERQRVGAIDLESLQPTFRRDQDKGSIFLGLLFLLNTAGSVQPPQQRRCSLQVPIGRELSWVSAEGTWLVPGAFVFCRHARRTVSIINKISYYVHLPTKVAAEQHTEMVHDDYTISAPGCVQQHSMRQAVCE